MSEESESEERINIMTLGNSTVGKSSFIVRFTENQFQETYLATVGIDFKVKTVTIKEKNYKLFFYDTTGQEKYKSISLNIIKNAHGIILMYDVTNRASFESIPDWIKSVKDAKGENFPMIILGNKMDMENKRIVKEEEGKQIADEYNINFFETSNLNGINVQEAGLGIVKKILDKREKENTDNTDYNSNSTSKLSSRRNTKVENKKKCC